MNKGIIVLLALFVLLINCKRDDSKLEAAEIKLHGSLVNLNDTVDVKTNDTIIIEKDKFKLIFNRVATDSRCPSNANCIWEGYAQAEFTYLTDSKPAIFYLNTTPAYAKNIYINNYLIKLIAVLPYPVIGGIEPVDYTIKITVKAPSNEMVKGTVKDYTNLDGCGYIIILDNGTKLEAVNLKSIPFKFKDNQRIILSYNPVNSPSICMAGQTIQINEIYEVIE